MTTLGASVFEWIPVDDLELDVENPRIAKFVEMYPGKITAEGMSLALGAGVTSTGESGTTFASLKESIRTNKGLIHPIIVKKNESGRLVVTEGNTRALTGVHPGH